MRAVRADGTWRDFGVNGQGIVVANIDTGVALDHPALAGSYRGNLGGSFTHDYNWYDPHGTFETPGDDNGHGTHTMGTMVGAPVNGVNGVGIAPGAQWIAARGCVDLYCNDADLIASAEWLLAPTRIDGTAPRPDLRPMIVNNSWSGAGGDQWFAPYIAAWRAAGIFPVFAAGNAAGIIQACGSIASPADDVGAVAVGAVGEGDIITNFSLLGPTRDGRTKPDFVAPGGAVYSTYPPKLGGYRTLSGTSMASPHVAAAVALLWSANPALIGDYDSTYVLLRESAKKLDDARCGDQPTTPNNVYGNGRIDAYAAVEQARVDVPWLSVAQSAEIMTAESGVTLEVQLDARLAPGPGLYTARVQLYSDDLTQPLATIPITMRVSEVPNQKLVEGRVVNAETGEPLQASVALSQEEHTGPAITTDPNGAFRLTIVDGANYRLTVRAASFVTQDLALNPDGGRIDVRLELDMPRLVLPESPITANVPFASQTDISFPLQNRGTQPLFYRVDVPEDVYIARRSDMPNGPSFNWIDLPPSAKVLELGDDVVKDKIPLGIKFPFYSYILTDSVVTSDGMLTFEKPFTYRGPTTGCMPDQWINFYLIAPLRLDLDTTKGGSIRYGTVGEQFVLSYENVPLQNAAPGQVYTFQLVLHADGRIVFQYKQLGPLPNRTSVGIQRSPTDIFSLGCGTTTPVHDQLAIELQPQPNVVNWLSTTARSGTLKPGERVDIPLNIRWARPSPEVGPYQARIVINSNDRRQNPAIQRVLITPRPAPYEVWLNLGVKR